MSVYVDPNGLRATSLGVLVSKAYATLAVETKTLFTVSGGICLITSLVGKVTTAITVAGTSKLQANPTTGTTSDLCAATDLGTTDTPAGNLLSLTGVPADSIVSGIGAANSFKTSAGIFIAPGTIEQVNATGADGAITWYLTYVPIESGSTIVAA